MENIKIAIEGAAADEAARALFEIEGVSGDFEIDSDVKRDGGLTVVATVIGIVGGTMAIAEQIRKWYAEYKARQSPKKLEKVLFVTANGRLLLEGATVEDIKQVLDALAE